MRVWGRHGDMLQSLRSVLIYNLKDSLDATLLTLWLSARRLEFVDLHEVRTSWLQPPLAAARC